MSPFFRGSVRPPRRHPRPWSMNPRLNPDLVMDDANEKENLVEPAEVRLPVTNSIYGKPIESTAVPDLPATNGRHTTGGETQAAVPETYSGTATTGALSGGDIDFPPAGSTEPTSDPVDEIPKGTAQPGQSLGRGSTRDSGTVMIDSPYLNDFVEKASSDPEPHEAIMDVPHVQEHARADSSTIGTAETGRYSGSDYDTQAIDSDGEDAIVDDTTARPAAVDGLGGAGDVPGGFPEASEEALVTASESQVIDEQPASGTASTFTDGTAAGGEPLMEDAQLEVSDEFKPATVIHEEPPEPLISDEQLEVDDEFKPQTKLK
ncbi:hypothetical protein VMCG_01788 [Cytospora schulzeri]|uniref:Uncharacterized protein n=1 Tax=Cytospora schulzeri TaxID=448051 RepID=A0A423X3Z9_9PEZI|nr:hypothetical protein VMCG_01788 [Valsa malicola]